MPAKPRQPFKGFTGDQLKELCKACKLPVSGTKDALTQRLLADGQAAKYAYEAKRFNLMSLMRSHSGYDSDGPRIPSHESAGPTGMSVDELKDEARQAGLAVSGKRFDVVLRLLQAKNGLGQPKRARGEFAEDGTFMPQKRAKSMKLPDVDALGNRVRRMVDSDTSRWSNQKYKDFACNVLKLINKIITTEVLEKELVDRGEAVLAWQVCGEILSDFLRFEASGITGWGYLSWELHELSQNLKKLAESTMEAVQHQEPSAKAMLAQHTTWTQKLLHFKAYGHHGEDMKSLDWVCSTLASLAAVPQ